MTKTQTFQADASKRDRLREALPVVLEAVDAILDGLIYPKNNVGAANDTVGNNFYQQLVGAKHIRTNLTVLTQEAKPPEELKGRRQYTEADREMLKAQQQEEQ